MASPGLGVNRFPVLRISSGRGWAISVGDGPKVAGPVVAFPPSGRGDMLPLQSWVCWESFRKENVPLLGHFSVALTR